MARGEPVAAEDVEDDETARRGFRVIADPDLPYWPALVIR
jgi:hypothetical protein